MGEGEWIVSSTNKHHIDQSEGMRIAQDVFTLKESHMKLISSAKNALKSMKSENRLDVNFFNRTIVNFSIVSI